MAAEAFRRSLKWCPERRRISVGVASKGALGEAMSEGRKGASACLPKGLWADRHAV